VTRSSDVADCCWAFCNQGRKRGGGWFEHFTLGTNYRLTGFQAAVLQSQLRRLPEQTRTRAANYAHLRDRLREVPGLRLPEDDPRISEQPHYLLTFWYDADGFEGLPRDTVLAALKAEGVPFKPTYPHPLYRNPVFGGLDLQLPVAGRACREGVWLSHNALLGDTNDVDDLIEALQKVRRLASTLHPVATERR
jgi:dTDP-4-amino-4,6-dideoxygalactose transaminase